MSKRLFTALFNVRIVDELIQSGSSPNLVIEPTEACKEQILRLGFYLKKTKNGVVVSAEYDEGAKPLESTKAIGFQFIVKNNGGNIKDKLGFTTPLFLPNSAIEIKGKPIFYFDNLDNTGKILRGSPLSLYDNSVSISEMDRAVLVAQNMSLEFTANAQLIVSTRAIEADLPIQVLDIQGQSVTNRRIEWKDSDKRIIPNGFYRGSWGNSSAEKVGIVKNDRLFGEPILGIIEIFENKDVDINQTSQYILEIKRQQTLQYLIFLPPQYTAANIELTSPVVGFDRKNNTQVAWLEKWENRHAGEVLLFQSQNPITVGDYNLQVKLKWGSGNLEKMFLPVPTVDSKSPIFTISIQ